MRTMAIGWGGVFASIFACNDSLVGQGYQGEPLFHIEGRVVDFDGTAPELSGATASLFWSRTGKPSTDPIELLEQPAVAVGIEFPAAFNFNIFQRPDFEELEDQPYLLGFILIWADKDGNGVYSQDELQGGAFDDVVIYANASLPISESPTRLPLNQGFTVVGLPLPCDAEAPDVSGEDCQVPLGQPCSNDSHCGTGTCLTNDGDTIYVDGYCVLPQSESCVPKGGALIDTVTPIGDVVELVWGQGCISNGDCRDSNYACAPDLAACIPIAPVSIFVTRTFGFSALCDRSSESP